MDCKTCKYYKWFPKKDKYFGMGMHFCTKYGAYYKKERIAVCNGRYYEAKEKRRKQNEQAYSKKDS